MIWLRSRFAHYFPRFAKPRQAEDTMRIDQPNDVADDLGRRRFSEHLLKLIRTVPAAHGVVIGLEGVWGAGKTWVLHDVQRLASEPDAVEPPVIVWFNPWMLSGTNDLVEAFLIQLASELGRSVKSAGFQQGAAIAQQVIDFTRVLGATKYLAPLADVVLPGSGLVLAAAGAAVAKAAAETDQSVGATLKGWQQKPESLSLPAARKRVVDLLQNSPRRIVVFIDDLDRLPPAELAAMIRAVKAVADFPNVVYVLAYDVDSAGPALEQALGLEKGGAGRRYLEKIVQLPVPLPELAAHRIQSFAITELRTVMASHAATNADPDDLEKALPLGAALMQTPRDVVRLCTKLAVVAPLAGKDLNPADLLLVEALALKAPDLIRYVDEHRGAMLLIGGSIRDDEHVRARGHLGAPDDGWDEETTKKRLEEDRVAWRALSGAGRNYAIEQAMRFLFDVAKPNDFERRPSASRLRIQNLRNWNRWRTLFEDAEFFENSEVIEWLAIPPDAFVFSEAEDFVAFCQLAEDLCEEVRPRDVGKFCVWIARTVEFFGDQSPSSFDLEREAASLVEKVLRREPQQIRSAAIRALLIPDYVWFCKTLIASAHKDAFGYLGTPARGVGACLIEDADEVSRISAIWSELAIKSLKASTNLTCRRDIHGLALQVSYLGGDQEDLASAVRRIVRECDQGLELLFANRGDNGNVHLDHFLPSVAELLEAVPRSPAFEEKHPKLVAHWRQLVDRGN